MYSGRSNRQPTDNSNLSKAKRILVANKVAYYADRHKVKNGFHVSIKPLFNRPSFRWIAETAEIQVSEPSHNERGIALFLSGLADRVSHPVCHLAGKGIRHGGRTHDCLGNTRYIFHM